MQHIAASLCSRLRPSSTSQFLPWLQTVTWLYPVLASRIGSELGQVYILAEGEGLQRVRGLPQPSTSRVVDG